MDGSLDGSVTAPNVAHRDAGSGSRPPHQWRDRWLTPRGVARPVSAESWCSRSEEDQKTVRWTVFPTNTAHALLRAPHALVAQPRPDLATAFAVKGAGGEHGTDLRHQCGVGHRPLWPRPAPGRLGTIGSLSPAAGRAPGRRPRIRQTRPVAHCGWFVRSSRARSASPSTGAGQTADTSMSIQPLRSASSRSSTRAW